jgi:GNAT superfamily N-acetyltransferase
MTYVVPPKNQVVRLRRFFEVELRHLALPLGESYTTVGPVMGAALWSPPGKWKPPASRLLRSAPAFLRVIGSRLPAAMRVMGATDRKHPKPHHWYLSTLGTEPDFQRKGVGSALIQPVLDRCDVEGVPAYLESSKEINVPYYRRHGFEVTDEVRVPNGPPLWLMWREPKARRPGEAARH